LNINYTQVTIDHKYPNDKRRHQEFSRICLRCQIAKVNPHLALFLNGVLRTESSVKDWYKALREYRNQTVLRPHFIANQITGIEGYFLPDNPTIIHSTDKIYLDVYRQEPFQLYIQIIQS
jgi:hypothetical protein